MSRTARWLLSALLLLLLHPLGCATWTAGRREVPSLSTKPFASTLPLVLIDADESIGGKSPMKARMKILESSSAEHASLAAATAAFVGEVEIQIRGSSSRRCPKKQYALSLRDAHGSARKAPLLGMPAAADWILQGPCFDRSLIRNPLAYDLSNRLGRYAVHTRFVEAFIRESGPKDPASHYAGVFVVMEKIARGPKHVDVAKVTDADPSGGYILRVDRGDDPHFVTARGTVIEYVDPHRPTPIQEGYLKKYFEDLESTLAGQSFADPSTGYARFLDVDSFVDHYLLNELLRNVDALRLSAYMHKDRGGKLVMGPIWDFDRSAGNIEWLASPAGWFLPRKFKNYDPPFWWSRLLQDPSFRQRVAQRWKALRRDTLSDASLTEAVDTKVSLIGEAAKRNFEAWPFLGIRTPPFNLDPTASPTYEGEVQELRTFLVQRARWMDGHMGTLGTGSMQQESAAAPAAPPSGGGVLRSSARGARHDAQAQQNHACNCDVELGDTGHRQGPRDAGYQNDESDDVDKKSHVELLLATARMSRPLARPA